MAKIKVELTNYDELSALDKAATWGPWTYRGSDGWIFTLLSANQLGWPVAYTHLINDNKIHISKENLELIVAMRNALPGMLAEMAEMRERMKQINGIAGTLTDAFKDMATGRKALKIKELSDV